MRAGCYKIIMQRLMATKEITRGVLAFSHLLNDARERDSSLYIGSLMPVSMLW